MHDYNVVWSWEAIYDVADITDYIELRFGKERADRFNDEIDAKGKNLGRNYRGVCRNRHLLSQKADSEKDIQPVHHFLFR